MKNIIYFPIIIGLLSCSDHQTKEEKIPTDYLTLSGQITNLKESDLIISDYQNTYSKTIKLNEDGSFSDSLKLPDSINIYTLKYGDEVSQLYLKNNHSLSLTLDTDQFDETLKYEGSISKENNYFAAKMLLDDHFDFMEFVSAKNDNFETDLENKMNEKAALLAKHPDIDTSLIASEKESIQLFAEQMRFFHNNEVEKAKILDNLVGKPSPVFRKLYYS